MFKIEAKKRVLKTLRDLDRDRKNRIKEALLILSNDPLPFKKLDVIKLKGYENTYRIRIGGLRIVYERAQSFRSFKPSGLITKRIRVFFKKVGIDFYIFSREKFL